MVCSPDNEHDLGFGASEAVHYIRELHMRMSPPQEMRVAASFTSLQMPALNVSCFLIPCRPLTFPPAVFALDLPSLKQEWDVFMIIWNKDKMSNLHVHCMSSMQCWRPAIHLANAAKTAERQCSCRVCLRQVSRVSC